MNGSVVDLISKNSKYNPFVFARDIVKGVGQVGISSYPKFKEEMEQLPLDMLNEMAQYEQENPLGSALSFTGSVVAGKTARGFKKAERLGKVFTGAVDELPRFEISDYPARLEKRVKPFDVMKLEEILEHPELYENYPELRKMDIEGVYSDSKTVGAFDSVKDNIEIAFDSRKHNPKKTLFHEIQHAIQEKEGFTKGGNIEGSIDEALKNLKDMFFNSEIDADTYKKARSDLIQNKFNYYRRLAGEVESRNVEGRMNWTEEMRQGKPFNTTLDIPIKQQIKSMRRVPVNTKDLIGELYRLLS